MALYTDSDCTNSAALAQLDPEVNAVLDAVGKGANKSALAITDITSRAWVECRSKLEAALATFSTYIGQAGSEAHLAAVLNTGLYGMGNRPRIRLGQIIASDTFYANSMSAIQQWVSYTALRLLFQAASYHFATSDSKADRYERKEANYDRQAKRLWSQLVTQGLPWILSPIDCPGSIHGWNAGTWDATALSFTADLSNTNSQAQDIQVAITYYNATSYVSPTSKGNSESGPSAILQTTIPPDQLLSVSIARLTPTSATNTPNVGLSQGVLTFLTPTHWQVYAGTNTPNAPLYLQAAGIPISTAVVTLPATLATSGYILQKGQVPEAVGSLLFGQIITRG